jgi:hypothetical protein
MTTKQISSGPAHKLPTDLRTALMVDKKALTLWESLTPLARNEWICWTIFPKKLSTRQEHVKRTVSELKEGMRRPCCWIGCIHRKDKAVSKSVQSILKKRAKTSKK